MSSCACVSVRGLKYTCYQTVSFLMLLTGRANENITRFPKCSASKRWSVKNTVCMTVPRLSCREKGKHSVAAHSQSVSPHLGSLCPYYLSSSSTCLKMVTLPKHTQWGVCAVALPSADSCKCLPLFAAASGPAQQCAGCSFKRSELVGK